MKVFEDIFDAPPEVVADAPGRVNLLGEHTDYNDGYVLPVAIAQRTQVAMRRTPGRTFNLYAANLDQRLQFTLDAPPREHFGTYVYGCLMAARSAGLEVPPLDIHVASSVPMGVGLSSSAALEVATLRALRRLFAFPIDDVALAQLAQRAEIEYAGVHCGVMDQMAASLADTSWALFLDSRTLERRLVPLPEQAAVLVLDSGLPRKLAASGYNQRRAECEEAARLLGVRALRDVRNLDAIARLPEVLRRRARHVCSENDRVLLALSCTDANDFGQLMNASHASLRDDYEVSLPQLDQLVALLQSHPGVYGARITGAGFGGACVALCRPEAMGEVAADVLKDYAAQGGKGRQLVP